jgi:hypothetical protein
MLLVQRIIRLFPNKRGRTSAREALIKGLRTDDLLALRGSGSCSGSTTVNIDARQEIGVEHRIAHAIALWERSRPDPVKRATDHARRFPLRAA